MGNPSMYARRSSSRLAFMFGRQALLLAPVLLACWSASLLGDDAISTIVFQAGYQPLAKPVNVAVDLQGNLYVSDCNTHTIRKITIDGTLSVLAGSGSPGHADGTGTGASFFNPTGIAVDSAGMVYVADYNNQIIRTVTPGGAVTTIAGQPMVPGHANGSGSIASFSNPCALAVDTNGIIYVADQGNNTIRRVTQAGSVSTIAGLAGSPGSANGNGSIARFRNPCGIAVDALGYLYVADQQNETIRKISPNYDVSTIAGQVGVPGSAIGSALTSATFNLPTGIAVGHDGTLYITDYNTSIIRAISPAGQVSTIAGTAGNTGSTDATGTAASFNGPEGVAVDGAGRLYIADTFNNLIRLGFPPPSAIPAANDAWQPLGTGTGLNVSPNWGLATSGSQVYVSGNFTAVDGMGASHIAQWTGGGWSPLGTGLGGEGDDIAISGGIVYEIGKFTTAGAATVGNVAAWDGSSWSATGAGCPNYPYAATIYKGKLVVAGGTASTPFVQQWDGTSWSTIGTGTGGWVYSLCQYGNDLIIGGDYHGLGGVGNDFLVSWDGTSLSVPGGGVNANASQTMVANGNLYIDGIFTTAGGNPVTNIAYWDGTSWHAMGSTFTGGNEALVNTPDGIYAFGSGTNTPGSAALWNGTSWDAVAGGTNGDFTTAGAFTGGIALAGSFTTAGGKAARGVAVFNPKRIAYAGTLAAPVHVPMQGRLAAVDAAGNALTISLLSQPLHGSVVLLDAASGTCAYTGLAGYVGPESFVFQGSDYAGVSNPATVLVTVSDTSPPVVSFASPTGPTYSTGSTAAIAISGLASDDVGAVTLSYALSGATTASASLAVGPTWSFTTPTLGIGTTTVVVTAHDAAGNAGSATLSVVVSPPAIISPLTATGFVGYPFTYTITASGLPSSYSASGLPGGLSFNSATGIISGSPLAVGVSNVTIGATNLLGTGTATLVLTVALPVAPVITSPGSVSATVGSLFSYAITATNSPLSYATSQLPDGLSLNSGTGLINGTPTAGGTSVVAISATNPGGTGIETLTITVAAAGSGNGTASPPTGTGGCGFGSGIAALLAIALAVARNMPFTAPSWRRAGRPKAGTTTVA
jgi:hypothetical protein